MKIVKFLLVEQDNNHQSLENVNKKYISEFCEKFGGATVYKAQGYWVDGGKLYEDNTLVCEIFVKKNRWALRRYFKKQAKKYMQDAKQLAVSVIIDGKAYIIK